MMKLVILVLLLPVWSLAGAERLYEKAAMHRVTNECWTRYMGTWDTEGRPKILDLSYTSYRNPSLFSETFGGAFHIVLDRETGGPWRYGIQVHQATSGDGRIWTAHIPYSAEYTGVYHLVGPGMKDVAGGLGGEKPGPPSLNIWEEEGRVRWEVNEAWQVRAELSDDGGETWRILGAEANGSATLRVPVRLETWVRIHAWRGLRCYSEVFIPGQGFVQDPEPYLKPTFFQNQYGSKMMSTYPNFNFGDMDSNESAKDYRSRVLVIPDHKKLPFDPARLFPGKCVQLAFQAEWKNLPPLHTFWDPDITVGYGLLRDPKHDKGLMYFFQVSKDAVGSWKAELMCRPGPGTQNGKPVDPKKHGFSAGIKDARGYGRKDLKVDFSSYWVLVAD